MKIFRRIARCSMWETTGAIFDILVGYTTVPGLMGFVAKKEMEKIPLLSKWMLNVNCLFLDRNNIKEGLKTILAGIEKVRRGVSVWIFSGGNPQ